jgi:HAD superfamily hydrolase (TIGR01549 family)
MAVLSPEEWFASMRTAMLDRKARSHSESDFPMMLTNPAFLFDLDGTLVDSVYQHVWAWQEALDACGIELAVWRIHRRIGMSGGLVAAALLRETGRPVTPQLADELQQHHSTAYSRQLSRVRSLPGAQQLLHSLSETGAPWAIATSGRSDFARKTLAVLNIASEVVLITRDQVERAKPDPDLYIAAAERLQVDIVKSIVVGDSVWDLLGRARRAR